MTQPEAVQLVVPGGRLTQGYGMTAYAKTGAYGGRIHDGWDIAANMGSRINWPIPIASYSTGWEPAGFGNYTVGRIGPWEFLSGHELSTGNLAFAGLLGSTGFSSGPHTHERIKLNGVTVDPQVFFNSIGASNMTAEDEQYRERYAELLYLYGPERPASRAERRSRLDKKANEVYGDIMGSKEAYEALTALFVQVYHLAFGPQRKIVHGRDISPRVDRIKAGKSTFLKEIAEIADSPERKEYLKQKGGE